MQHAPAPREHWSAWRRSNHGFFKRHLEPLPKERALVDLGAGPVQFDDLFFKFKYTGVDFEKYDHVSVVTDLTKAIPLPDVSADIVTLSNVLEHIPNTEHFLAECKRLLRPGGVLVGTIPFLQKVHQAPYDFNRYTHYQLERLLNDAGFTDVEVVPLGRQIDVYNTIELKTFDELYLAGGGILLKLFRLWRRAEMRLLVALFGATPASLKVNEGYGFYAKR